MSPLPAALPFWLSLGLPPLALLGMALGGWTIALLPLSTWWLFTILDAITGHNTDNPDPQTADERELTAYRLVTLIWPGVQFALLRCHALVRPAGPASGYRRTDRAVLRHGRASRAPSASTTATS
jgi:alkane 1-monooxygenase